MGSLFSNTNHPKKVPAPFSPAGVLFYLTKGKAISRNVADGLQTDYFKTKNLLVGDRFQHDLTSFFNKEVVIRDILDHSGASSDDSAFANGYAWQNRDIGAEPSTVADGDSLKYVLVIDTLGIKLMSDSNDAAVGSNLNVMAKIGVFDVNPSIDVAALTEDTPFVRTTLIELAIRPYGDSMKNTKFPDLAAILQLFTSHSNILFKEQVVVHNLFLPIRLTIYFQNCLRS